MPAQLKEVRVVKVLKRKPWEIPHVDIHVIGWMSAVAALLAVWMIGFEIGKQQNHPRGTNWRNWVVLHSFVDSKRLISSTSGFFQESDTLAGKSGWVEREKSQEQLRRVFTRNSWRLVTVAEYVCTVYLYIRICFCSFLPGICVTHWIYCSLRFYFFTTQTADVHNYLQRSPVRSSWIL